MSPDLSPPRATPPHISERLVRLLDDGFRIPGTSLRFGLDAVIGLLLPELGDVIGGIASLTLVWTAIREGLPKSLIARMLLNVGIDALVGAVPLVGDLFDFAFKANRRNLDLLERHRTGTKVKVGALEILVFALSALFVVGAIALPIVLMVMLTRWLFG